MKKETRSLKEKATVEKRDDGSVAKICGYAAVFNRDSGDLGFIEQIAPGAFKNALKRSDVRALKNHDSNLIFGRQNVNLALKEDKNGLYYEAEPLDTHCYRETAKEIELGLLDGQSFGFTVKSDEWRDLDTDKPKRIIREIEELFDVGPVTYPAYPDTSVAFRNLEEAKKELEEAKNSRRGAEIADEQARLHIDILMGELA